MRTTTSYTTPPRPVTVDDITSNNIDPPRAAFALEWTLGDGTRALDEATAAFDSVVKGVFASLIADVRATTRPAKRAGL